MLDAGLYTRIEMYNYTHLFRCVFSRASFGISIPYSLCPKLQSHVSIRFKSLSVLNLEQLQQHSRRLESLERARYSQVPIESELKEVTSLIKFQDS